ncbi:hypothetical protein PV703_32460 [Streptomyces sp. ME01-24h]|nr:hypothetical protein [Streptomyces sp. ME19-03-3]MDX3214931.1 hypothetical protein [Streptomyces sp. ME02-6991-2B]MDX3357919.1 hypothetical protein [Streptomyces sp. ME01-24h]
MTDKSPNVRTSRLLRWLLMAGLSYMFATFIVLGGLSLLPKETQMNVSESAVGWLVLVVGAILFSLLANKTKGRGRS